MRKLVREELVDHLDYSTSGEIGVCEACIGGKQSKSPFEQSRAVTLMPLELVHSDVCGKMGQKSLGGAEYFLTLLDDKTHYAWVYPLKTKDEVFQYFKEWQVEVENFTGHKVKTLRTDNGGEYTSNSFQAYLKTCGIRHELTIPKTPEQNGVAERLNRTLVEATRAMLLDAKLPHRFWAEAISTATYLRNRSPTSAVKGATPHQALYGERPRMEHLRVFGSTAHVHIPKDERGKLDSKTKKWVLLGYGNVQKGYRVYHHATRKVFYSRNVKFDSKRWRDLGFRRRGPYLSHWFWTLRMRLSQTTREKLILLNPHHGGLSERGGRWTTTVFHRLTSPYTRIISRTDKCYWN